MPLPTWHLGPGGQQGLEGSEKGVGEAGLGEGWLPSRVAPGDAASALLMPSVSNYVLISPVSKLESGVGWW